MSLPFLHVVAGLLIEEGKIFIAQRKDSDSSPGRWEFPGGKVEDGELPREALIREWEEELGVQIEVLRIFGSNRFKTERAEFHLELYRVHRISGDFQLHEHQAHAWVTIEELQSYDLLSGDQPFVTTLKALFQTE